MMKIVLVGGAGYIGTAISKKLHDDGHHLTILDRNIFLSKEQFCTDFVMKDTRDIKEDIFKDVDLVLDYSGISNDPSGDIDEKLTYSINISGRNNIAKCAKNAGVPRYVFASTCSVYGAVESLDPVDETYELKPLTAYAKSAVEMEKKLKLLACDDFKVLCIRHGTVYGFSPKMRLDLVINLMCKNAIENGKIFVTGGGNQRRPLVSLKTISSFISILTTRQENFIPSGTYDIVNLAEENVKMNELAYRLASFIEKYKKQEIQTFIVPDDADKRDYSVNIEKMRNFYSFSPEYLQDEVLLELINGLKELDVSDARYVTQKWYRYILGLEKNLIQVGKLSR